MFVDLVDEVDMDFSPNRIPSQEQPLCVEPENTPPNQIGREDETGEKT
jgi:hypothetical protein